MRINCIIFLFTYSCGILSSQNWQSLGTSTFQDGYVHTLYNDTVNNLLYAGGQFDSIEGKKIRGIGVWNGVSWDSLGEGIDSHTGTYLFTQPRKIIGYHNKIYVFGNFNKAGPYSMDGMGIWNGTSWEYLADVPNGLINDAAVYNDTLYICGLFDSIGPMPTRYAAKFDGTNWYPMHFPFDAGTSFSAIRAFNGKVYATGAIYANGYGLLAEWNGSSWAPWVGVQGDVNKAVWGFEVIDNQLFIYGRFWSIGGVWSPGIVSWDGNNWYGFGGGFSPTTWATVHDIKKIGNYIYAVGPFSNAGGQSNNNNNILMNAFWNGTDWCITGDVYDNILETIELYNNEIIVGGGFWSINGDSSIKKIAKWIGGNFTSACGNSIGLNENKKNGQIRVYPNPATEFLNIESEIQIDSEIQILDILGREVVTSIITNKSRQVDIANLPAGVYFVMLKIAGEIHRERFLKE